MEATNPSSKRSAEQGLERVERKRAIGYLEVEQDQDQDQDQEEEGGGDEEEQYHQSYHSVTGNQSSQEQQRTAKRPSIQLSFYSNTRKSKTRTLPILILPTPSTSTATATATATATTTTTTTASTLSQHQDTKAILVQDDPLYDFLNLSDETSQCGDGLVGSAHVYVHGHAIPPRVEPQCDDGLEAWDNDDANPFVDCWTSLLGIENREHSSHQQQQQQQATNWVSFCHLYSFLHNDME